MQWLVYGTVSSGGIEALHRHEQKTRTADQIGLSAAATPREVLLATQKHQLELLTADATLTNALYEQRLAFPRCIVLLNVQPGDVEQDDAIDRLFARYKRLTPGRLYTVTESRVKIRQLPRGAGGNAE